MIQYRGEIDGLRGLAVCLVVLFHAGLPYITGGFVGVDIFFVISGFLITSIILKDIRSQKFSFIQFYERRIRRILPALYFMTAISFSVACYMQTPTDLIKSSYSALAALLFSANIYFWRTTNYFSDASDYEPFLHTWSLGVEEQFYFIFPVLILLLIKTPRYLKALVLSAFLGSLVLSIYATYNYTWAAYYLLPSRAWQLMAGAILAIHPLSPPKSKNFTLLLSIVATLSLIIPAFTYNQDTRFPGIAAIPPTLGAVLLIILGQDKTSLLFRVFSSPIFVWLGLISYSLYLWHWPIFAFIRNYQAEISLPLHISIAGVLLSVLMGYLSWRFIESPFRNREKFTSRNIFISSIISSILLIFAFSQVIFFKGLPNRLDPKVIAYNELSENNMLSDPCLHKTAEQITNGDVCILNRPASTIPNILLWGDSHSAALKPGYEWILRESNLNGAFIGGVGCPPLPGILKVNFDDGKDCLNKNSATLEYLKNTPSIKTVLLHARWGLIVEGSRYGDEGGPSYILQDTYSEVKTVSNDNVIPVKSALNRLIMVLNDLGKKVVIIGPIPEAGFHVPRHLANSLQWGKTSDIRPSVEGFLRRQERVLELFHTILAENENVRVLLPHHYLCKGTFCAIEKDGNSLYFDDDHLTSHGAAFVAESMSNDYEFK